MEKIWKSKIKRQGFVCFEILPKLVRSSSFGFE